MAVPLGQSHDTLFQTYVEYSAVINGLDVHDTRLQKRNRESKQALQELEVAKTASQNHPLFWVCYIVRILNTSGFRLKIHGCLERCCSAYARASQALICHDQLKSANDQHEKTKRKITIRERKVESYKTLNQDLLGRGDELKDHEKVRDLMRSLVRNLNPEELGNLGKRRGSIRITPPKNPLAPVSIAMDSCKRFVLMISAQIEGTEQVVHQVFHEKFSQRGVVLRHDGPATTVASNNCTWVQGDSYAIVPLKGELVGPRGNINIAVFTQLKEMFSSGFFIGEKDGMPIKYQLLSTKLDEEPESNVSRNLDREFAKEAGAKYAEHVVA